MLPFRLVYHEEYDLHLGDHVFPSKKYKWLHDRLIQTRFAAPEDFVSPQPASVEDLLLAHDTEWVVKLKSGVLTYQDILRLEIPYSRQMAQAFCLATGGTILAAQLARFAAPEDFVSPQPASVEGLLLAHDTEWVVKLKSGVLTYQDILRLEIPYSRQMAQDV